jgi:multidrug efflux pump subunit AcrA (membrane-fusion protein)
MLLHKQNHKKTVTAVILLGSIASILAGVFIYKFESASIGTSAEVKQEETFVVRQAQLTTRLVVAGTIRAGKLVAVVAPVEGTISKRDAEIGDYVKAGATLIELDVSEVENRLRDAEAAVLKAAVTANSLENWQSSPDVLRAKRSVETGQDTLVNLERQVADSKKLFDRGIVPRNDYDSLVQQRNLQKVTIEGLKQDLEATLNRGSEQLRRVAALDLENARARYASLQAQIAARIVKAPASGILVRPPAPQQLQGGSVSSSEVGAHISQGQPLFSVADTTTLMATGKVDELDVNALRLGADVEITGEAFPGSQIHGRISGISAEAASDQSGKAPNFEIRVSFANDDERRKAAIKLGMSAKMSIEVRNDGTAMLIPLSSIGRDHGTTFVQVRDKGVSQLRRQEVSMAVKIRAQMARSAAEAA